MRKIAIFGFGSVGQALAELFHQAGKDVIICSKGAKAGKDKFATATFEKGATEADTVALAIPFTAAQSVLTPLKPLLSGKTIIECTNPLNEDWSPLVLEQNKSAAETIAEQIPEANVVKAFNTVFADVMPLKRRVSSDPPMTAFIAGNDTRAKADVMSLATLCEFDALDTGPLKNARYLEAMAHLNIAIAVGQNGGTQAAFFYKQVK